MTRRSLLPYITSIFPRRRDGATIDGDCYSGVTGGLRWAEGGLKRNGNAVAESAAMRFGLKRADDGRMVMADYWFSGIPDCRCVSVAVKAVIGTRAALDGRGGKRRID